MTANRRIFLNIIATYGRSLYALIIGLISGRWVLRSLGEIDYGLLGLIGGMIAFVSFFNGLLASAVGRFYAFAVGEAKKDVVNGLENCRKWFNVALSIHTVVPLLLVVVGYPVGVWAIEHFLSIPIDRIDSCVWVWRFTCLSCFVAMSSVPFHAMYAAKQEIAELTVYSVISTTVNFVFLSYMIAHPGFWLTRYSAWSCFVAITPSIIIAIRACYKYPECRFVREYLWNAKKMRELTVFAGGRLVCALTFMINQQGRALLVNKILGPAKNAAMAISNTVTSHTTTLMSAISTAFNPAITNACGSGNYELMRALGFRMCKFGSLSVVIFAVPLILEIDNVMRLWLIVPPAGSASLCVCCLLEHCLSRLVDGHVAVVMAKGKIGVFNVAESFGYLFSFILTWTLLYIGVGLISIGYVMLMCFCYTAPIKLYFARKFGGMSIRYWMQRIAVPILVTALISFVASCPVRMYMSESFDRVILTTISFEVVFLPLVWQFVLDDSERGLILKKMPVLEKMRMRR